MNASINTVRGGTQLAFDSVEVVTNTVERMHETIARHPPPWAQQPEEPTTAHGLIASGVYAAIRGINGALRQSVNRSFELLADHSEPTQRSSRETKVVAALNGVLGDHLDASGNTLATQMSLMVSGEPLQLDRNTLTEALPKASGHLVVMVHGSSLSELCWTHRDNTCIGSRLQDELGHTPLYLRYNTGRHISSNGQDFAELLEHLCAAWPVPVESLSVIGHSMGGLVIRSACWYAQQADRDWLQRLQRVVCLGTPHHGSHVERAGHALDMAMQRIPYTEPLALGRVRSVGIKDLRHGNLLDEDWQGHNPDHPGPDRRRPVPLLPDVDYYFVAATLGQHLHDPLGRILGDFLVRLDSATGAHDDDLHRLNVKPENCRVYLENSHFDLLDDEQVHRQIVDWFR